MKDTISKDKRRISAIQQYNNYHRAWRISCKYSKMLVKNINNDNLYEISLTIHKQYMTELYNNQCNMNKNYTQVWDTMLNTVQKNNDNMKGSVRLLHQISVQRTHK